MKSTTILLFLLAIFSFVSCKKAAGEGGTSSISGKLIIEDYNNAGELQATYNAPHEDVFIIYGENSTTYNDKFKTSYDGSYTFKFLEKGTYKIFAYSDCDNCDSGTEALIQTITIDKNKTNYTAIDITIRK